MEEGEGIALLVLQLPADGLGLLDYLEDPRGVGGESHPGGVRGKGGVGVEQVLLARGS